jgi:hypothetical protein
MAILTLRGFQYSWILMHGNGVISGMEAIEDEQIAQCNSKWPWAGGSFTSIGSTEMLGTCMIWSRDHCFIWQCFEACSHLRS